MRFDAICGGALPELYIAVTHSEKKARGVIRRLEGRQSEEAWAGIPGKVATTTPLRSGSGVVYLVWIDADDGRDDAEDAAVIAHEAAHVSLDYLRGFGEDASSEELLAYVVQDVSAYMARRHFGWKRKRSPQA